MIDRLKTQREKLIINERHEAWGNLARKLAHEIKNPLTPIQLTIDRIKSKYSDQINDDNKDGFKENLKIINNQIKQIEKLVNDFSDFARMPKPVLLNNDLTLIIKDNITLLKQVDTSIKFNFSKNREQIILNSDKEQVSRVFLNLIKNSIESIKENEQKSPNINKNISIELIDTDDHIKVIINDTGIGFKDLNDNIKDILSPYFTTKKNGTGLGLSIVNKIINDHNGTINFSSTKVGAKIEIIFLK
jgi:two-component system nitrogen regulation sensor histidine kinase NtrY